MLSSRRVQHVKKKKVNNDSQLRKSDADFLLKEPNPDPINVKSAVTG